MQFVPRVWMGIRIESPTGACVWLLGRNLFQINFARE